MAEFKVGDRVRIGGPGGVWPGWPGDSRNGTVIGFDGEYVRVDHDAPSILGRQSDCGWRAETLTLIKPRAPKPKTIPARNLSGKHIGRVVTITTKDGIQISSELTLVRHLEGGVAVELKGVKAPGFTGAPFYLDPDSKVTLS